MRHVASLLLILILGLCSLAGYADSPACTTNFMLLQATNSAPARVTGTPGEHLTLFAYDPQYDANVSSLPSNMYLLSGNVVQVIATCNTYAYVRYQGSKQISTGGVEKARLKYVGTPQARPRDTVAQVCRAAASTVNRNGANSFFLTRVPLKPVPILVRKRVTAGDNNVAEVMGMARIKIHGRAVKVFVILGQGSASSIYLRIWSDDLSKLIADTDASLGFGDGQELVQVLGHPLVMRVHYTDPTKFSLASINQDGKPGIICNAQRGYAPTPRITTGGASRVCHAVIAGSVTVIPLQSAEKREVVLPANLKRYASNFSLIGSAHINFLNNGKKISIGLLAYSAYRGDPFGGHPVHAVFPVVLNSMGLADLTDAMNMKIVKDATGSVWFDAAVSDRYLDSPRGGRIVTYVGQTYFVLYNEPLKGGEPSLHTLTGVLRFTTKGSEYACKFQPNHFTVTPVAELATEALL